MNFRSDNHIVQKILVKACVSTIENDASGFVFNRHEDEQMKTLTLEAEVEADGTLHVEVESGLPPGKVEVTLLVQPLTETHSTTKTGYEWLLDAKYDNLGRVFIKETNPSDNLTQAERAKRIMELLDIALKDVTWEEIEAGREDRCF